MRLNLAQGLPEVRHRAGRARDRAVADGAWKKKNPTVEPWKKSGSKTSCSGCGNRPFEVSRKRAPAGSHASGSLMLTAKEWKSDKILPSGLKLRPRKTNLTPEQRPSGPGRASWRVSRRAPAPARPASEKPQLDQERFGQWEVQPGPARTHRARERPLRSEGEPPRVFKVWLRLFLTSQRAGR